MTIDISEYPTLDDISDLVITPDQFNPRAFSQVANAFETDEMENPYAATEEMVEHVRYIRDMGNDVQKLEALVELFSSDTPIERQVEIEVPGKFSFLGKPRTKKKMVTERTLPVRLYYDSNKTEARNARELFEYAMKPGKVPTICMENTLIWLALGNAVQLKVGAYDIPTWQQTVNGKKIGSMEEHREHIVPVVFIKGKEKYHAIKIETPSNGKRAELVEYYTNYHPHTWDTIVLVHMNNYRSELSKKARALLYRANTIDDMLMTKVDADNLLLRNHATDLFSKKKYDEALPLFERLQKEHEKKHGKNKGSHAEALMYKGKTLFGLKRYDEAIKAFEEFFPTDLSDKFWEFQRYGRIHSLDDPDKFEGYRGIYDSSDLGHAMVLWGLSLEARLSKRQKLSPEEKQLKDRLDRYAIEFGFENVNLLQRIVSQDMDRAPKDVRAVSLIHEKELQWHYAFLAHWLVEDYQMAEERRDEQKLTQAREAIYNFMFETMNFYADYDTLFEYQPHEFLFLKTSNLLSMIISDPKMKERVEKHGKVIGKIGDYQYQKILSDKPWDFNLRDVVSEIPIELSFGAKSAHNETRRLVGLRNF